MSQRDSRQSSRGGRGGQPNRDAQAERDRVQAILDGIVQRRIEREQELSSYPTTALQYVEGEDTDTPYLDRFLDVGGSAAIEDMTNFSTREFNELWLSIRDFVVLNYNVGRGRRSAISAKDALFMTLVTLKEGGTWQSLSDIFEVPTTSFTETVTKYIEMLAPKLYVDQVQDKGYQGLAKYLRCIHPKKGRSLSRAELINNDKISSDRVLVENYFGRLNQLWRVTSDKYRWGESLYDDLFRLCVALTNYHVSFSPLRQQNGEWYRQAQHKLIQLGLKIKEKRRLAQEMYRAKKRRRQSTELGDLGGENDASADALTQLSQSL